MRTARRWPVAAALLAPAVVVAGPACSLTTSLDGYTGPTQNGSADAAPDSPPPVDAPADGLEPPIDAASAVASCDALKRTRPTTPDGLQVIDPDGFGPVQPFLAYCDT